MRRRQILRGEVPPPRLTVFDDRDWRGATLPHRFAAWRAARTDWRSLHGWPGDDIVFVQDQHAQRRRAFGLPEPQDVVSL